MKYIKTIFSVSLFLFANIAFAQGVLEVKDVSLSNEVFTGADDEAVVMIRCHQSIPLTFSSSMDKTADPFKVELQGTDSLYYIIFPTGKNYRGRELTIVANGYTPVIHKLELQPKQSVTLHVTDPNALVDAGCYREHRNKGILEIKNSNYEEAKNLFVVARDCSDVDQTENEKNISLTDSLITFRLLAEQAFKLLDYREAMSYYSKVYALNTYDTYAKNQSELCSRKQRHILISIRHCNN